MLDSKLLASRMLMYKSGLECTSSLKLLVWPSIHDCSSNFFFFKSRIRSLANWIWKCKVSSKLIICETKISMLILWSAVLIWFKILSAMSFEKSLYPFWCFFFHIFERKKKELQFFHSKILEFPPRSNCSCHLGKNQIQIRERSFSPPEAFSSNNYFEEFRKQTLSVLVKLFQIN